MVYLEDVTPNLCLVAGSALELDGLKDPGGQGVVVHSIDRQIDRYRL